MPGGKRVPIAMDASLFSPHRNAAAFGARPSRAGALAFRAKAAVFQLRRAARNLAAGPRRHPRAAALEDAPVLGQSVSALWTEEDPAERALVAG